MIWLAWRQHRSQLLFGLVFLAVICAALLLTGFGIASTFRSSGLAQCLATPNQGCGGLQELFNQRYSNLQFTIPLFLVLPALIGIFWGAPLVAREVEQGTHRLAWTQSVGRLRWAITKIGFLSLATVVAAGLLSFVLSWWSRPFVTASNNQFGTGIFDLRGIVPLAYALFSLAIGVAVGTLIRRTVPAMAASLGVFAAVRLSVDLLRPHFASPLTITYPLAGFNPRDGLGDWVLSTKTVDAAGHFLSNGAGFDLGALGSRCPGLIPSNGSFPDKSMVEACAQRLGLQVQSVYQPGSRYWTFQGIEAAIFVALAVGLFAFSLWWIRHRVA
jgi:hypothetical protein